nr:Mobile element protein [Escherichia coli]
MDETYVKVMAAGRIVPGRGQPGPHVDFYLSSRRNSKAAIPFLGKILTT